MEKFFSKNSFLLSKNNTPYSGSFFVLQSEPLYMSPGSNREHAFSGAMEYLSDWDFWRR